METLEKSLATKVKVIKEEACLITFSIELPKDEVVKETDSVFEAIQRQAALPGFRTGKAPLDLIRKNFTERARQRVLENLIGRAAAQVIRERNLQTIDTPKVDKIEFELNKPLLFHMSVEKDPEIKAKDYKGIKVNRHEGKVTDEAIQKTLDELRDRNASLVASTATKVEKHHFAVIDFEGKIEGKAFKGGSATNYLLDMNTPQTIAGFSDGILGASLAEKRAVKVTFPADYPHKEWASKEALFDVTVKEIKEKKMPALDDEFAKDLGLGSLAELKTKIQENLEKEIKGKSDKEVEDQLYQTLLDKNTFAVPPTLVEERTQALLKRTRATLERQGLLTPNDQEADKALLDKVRPQAEKDVRLSYLLKAISTQEKLAVTNEDVETLKKKALEENQQNKEGIETYFKDHGASIQASLLEGKVMDFLKSNAKIKIVNE